MANDSLNIFEKIKLLLWVRSLFNGGVKMGGKLGELLQKLDGMKSIAGLLLVVAYYVVPQFTSVHLPDVVLKFGASLASAGLAHKLEKGTGIVSKVLDGVKAGLDAITAKEQPPKA